MLHMKTAAERGPAKLLYETKGADLWLEDSDRSQILHSESRALGLSKKSKIIEIGHLSSEIELSKVGDHRIFHDFP